MSKYNPNTRTDWVDKKLNLTVGKVQVIRTQFYRFNAKVPEVAERYKLHPRLVKSIKRYRVWADIMPLGFKD